MRYIFIKHITTININVTDLVNMNDTKILNIISDKYKYNNIKGFYIINIEEILHPPRFSIDENRILTTVAFKAKAIKILPDDYELCTIIHNKNNLFLGMDIYNSKITYYIKNSLNISLEIRNVIPIKVIESTCIKDSIINKSELLINIPIFSTVYMIIDSDDKKDYNKLLTYNETLISDIKKNYYEIFRKITLKNLQTPKTKPTKLTDFDVKKIKSIIFAKVEKNQICFYINESIPEYKYIHLTLYDALNHINETLTKFFNVLNNLNMDYNIELLYDNLSNQ